MKTFEKSLVGKEVQLFNRDNKKIAEGMLVKLEQYLYVVECSGPIGEAGFLKHGVSFIRAKPR